MELLFSSITSKLLDLANSAARDVFGPSGAPQNLISVHLRWGDKGKENQLVPVSQYISEIARSECLMSLIA